MIKFHIDDNCESKPLFLEDVCINQFFISVEGYLCQKIDSISFNILADEYGKPFALSYLRAGFDRRCAQRPIEIKKTLPKISKITWE